ncbi:MAG: hypothetical protein C4B58_05295 [Deltaproteobacteria bacterium]|nr:MAG: hypothetical protein C4B58_05295 [Deltaproteobacteria bacterium]
MLDLKRGAIFAFLQVPLKKEKKKEAKKKRKKGRNPRTQKGTPTLFLLWILFLKYMKRKKTLTHRKKRRCSRYEPGSKIDNGN